MTSAPTSSDDPFDAARALALSLPPSVILLALTAGTILAGIIGALLAVPLAAVTWTAVTTWVHDKERTHDRMDTLGTDDPARAHATLPEHA